MKHKPSSVFLLSIAFILSSCSSPDTESAEANESSEMQETENIVSTISYSIDPEKSNIHWKGEMLGMYSHEGNIDIKESYISLENGELAGGGFIVDMTSINPTDENYKPKEGKTKEKLVEHLSSADFFDVTNHPKAMFDITEVMDGKLKGNLVIRDKKNEEVVENVVVEEENGVYHLTGTMTFDRQKYDVAFKHPVKEMVLSDEITLQLDFKTIARPEE